MSARYSAWRLGFCNPTPGLEGTVELIVEAEGEQPERQFLITLKSGLVEVSEVGGAQPTASVRGTVAAWVRALGPEGSTESLIVSGRDGLAGAVLDGLLRKGGAGAASAAA